MTTDNLEPLHAVITRRDGRYLITVSGVEIGTADDFVGATNRLCSEAAKYSRRVFVKIDTRQARQNLEIDESGVISRTTAPAAGPTPPPNARRPERAAGTPQTGHPSPTPVSAVVAAKAQRASRMRTVAPTVAKLAAAAAVCAAAAAVSVANFEVASDSRAARARWESVEPASKAQLRAARAHVAVDDQVEQLISAHAAAHDVRVSRVVATPDPRVWATDLGEVDDSGHRWSYTATGPGLAEYLADLHGIGVQFQLVKVETSGSTATITGRILDAG